MQQINVVSRYSHIKTSRDVHQCDLVPRCPVPRCQSPQFRWSRDVRSRDFSRLVHATYHLAHKKNGTEDDYVAKEYAILRTSQTFSRSCRLIHLS